MRFGPTLLLWPFCVLLLSSFTFSGCKEADVRPYSVFPVDGQFLIHDKPASLTVLTFHRLDSEGDYPQKRWSVVVKDDGHFVPVQSDGAIGLPSGKYALTIDWLDLSEHQEFEGQFSTVDKPLTTITVQEGINFIPPINLK